MGDMRQYRCSCGSLIMECGFWHDVSAGMAARGFSFDIADARSDLRAVATPFERRILRPLHRGPMLEALRDLALNVSPGWRTRLADHQARTRALVETVLTRARKQVLVDSSKIGLRLKYLLRTPGLDVRVIRVVRDGRAVALTYTDPAAFADAVDPSLKGGGSGASRDHQRLTMEAAASEWRRSNEEMDAVLGQVDRSRWTSIRYEELCADPKGTLQQLHRFIGVDPGAGTLDFRGTEHHVVGNGMRLDTTTEIRLDDRWRTVLGASELRTFATVAGSLNRRLGYA